MAKQLSMKQQMYQQIANSQVQQVMKEQRDQDLKMAQDLIAQYQPSEDDMALAQSLISQYKQPAPVKQATVNEVKAESTPRQQIPSLEDFFTPTTASGKNINKESAKYIQRNSYARQQQMENELASKSAKKSKEEIIKNAIEDKEVKPFVPETDIGDQNSVNDYRKNLLGGTEINGQSVSTERNELDELAKVFKASMKDYNPKFTAAGKRWENPYDSLTDEQKQLVRDYIIQNQNNTNLSKEERETLKAFNRAYNSSDEEKDSRYNGRAAYLNSKNDFERGLQSLAGGFTDFNMPVAELLGKGFSKLPILNQIDYEKSRDDTREYINESKALNPQAAEAGRSLGQIYDYAITSPFVGGLGEMAGLGKVGTAALNQVVQAGQDFGLDIYPEIQRMLKEEGKIDFGELAKRFGTDVVQNIVMESAPFLAAANYDSLVKSIGNNADIFKNIDATGALKNAPDAIRSVADATNNIKAANEGTQQIIPGMETESDVVNNINNDFSRLMAMYQPERTAMKNIYSAEDLNNSLNSQLANALKANQADEVAESVAKAMPETPMNSVANTIEDATKTADNVSAIKTEISDMTDAVIDRIYNVGYKVDAVNNEALNKSYRELLDYNEKWAKAISNSTDIEEIKRATKDLNNAISRFNTKAKKIDPSIAKDIYNRKFSSMLNSFNTRLDDYYNGAKRSKEAADLILGNQSDDALKEISELQKSKQALFDDVRNGRISARDYSYRMNEINRAESNLIDKYPDWYDNGTLKGTLEDYVPDNATKTMAEEISKPKSDIITSEPIKPGKYEIPDTPENTPIEQITDGNKKLSETYTNTGRNGGGWNAEEYNKYTDPEKYMYETIDEVTSVENATKMRQTEGREAFKERVLGAERVSSIELDGLMMEWRELTQEARALEEAGQDASKLWDESNRIFRKIREQSTSNAQALQALAKWSRNTPEGMLVEAENIINGRVAKEKSAMQKALDKYLKQNKIEIEFSPEFEKKFLKEAEKIEGLRGSALDSREAKEVMANLGKMVNEQIPVKMGDKLTTWLMDNMLGNFRTLISRNAGGNIGLNAMEQTLQRPLAAGIDSLVSLKTGKRTQAGLSVAGIADYLSGFKKGLADELKDVKTGLHTARSGENTLSNAIQSNKRVFKSRLLNLKDQLTRHGLSVGDRPFYESVYKQTLGDYDRLYKSGKMGADIQKLSPEEFKEYSEIAAHLNALGAVYQQDTTLSKALMGFKKDIGDLSKGTIGIDVLSQFSMPFVKTPANVIERAIDYSPLGAVRNTFRTAGELNNSAFDQNRFVNETARNIIGTGLMGGGLALAKNGVLSGAYSDNKDKKQAQKESGMQEYAWNVPEYIPGIGGKQMDISWVPVLGSNLVASAAAYDAYRNGEGDKLGNMATGLKKGGEALFDQSMFQGLQRLFGTGDSYNSDEGIVGNMANTVKSGLGQAIPSLVRQIAQVKDPYMRDTAYSNKGTSLGFMDNYDINSLANNVPELREQYLAPKVDTQGNLLKENQGRGLGSKVLEDMFLPGKLTEIQSNALSEEAQRLSDISGTGKAYIDKANRSLVDTEDHTLTNQEWVDYQQKYYKQMNSAGNKLIESDFYKSLDDTAKENTLSNMYSDIKSAVNSEYNGKELTGGAKVYAEAGGGDKGADALLKYYNAKQISKDAGVTTSSNAGKAIQEAINNGDTAEANKIAKAEANYNRACEIAGVTDKNSGTRKAYEEGGTVGLKEYVKKVKIIEKYDLDNNSTAKSVYDKYGENGLSQLSEFQKAGVKGGSAVGLYNSAKEELGSEVPTLKEYATTYKKIDSYGSGDKKNNGTVSQDEFKAYLAANNFSEEKAAELAQLYGDWKTIPKLTKDGWQFKKTK